MAPTATETLTRSTTGSATGQATGSCCCSARAAPAPAAPVDGRFALTDHFGQPATHASFGDRHLLVFFGFTHCAQVCPRELGKIGQALDLLGDDAQALQPLYITVDPERDTPERMRAYVEAKAPRFMGLTGEPAEVDAVKKRFRVFARRQEDASAPDGYVVPHTAFAYLLAPQGLYVAHFSDALDAQALARQLRLHLAAGAASVAPGPGADLCSTISAKAAPLRP